MKKFEDSDFMLDDYDILEVQDIDITKELKEFDNEMIKVSKEFCKMEVAAIKSADRVLLGRASH